MLPALIVNMLVIVIVAVALVVVIIILFISNFVIGFVTLLVGTLFVGKKRAWYTHTHTHTHTCTRTRYETRWLMKQTYSWRVLSILY